MYRERRAFVDEVVDVEGIPAISGGRFTFGQFIASDVAKWLRDELHDQVSQVQHLRWAKRFEEEFGQEIDAKIQELQALPARQLRRLSSQSRTLRHQCPSPIDDPLIAELVDYHRACLLREVQIRVIVGLT